MNLRKTLTAAALALALAGCTSTEKENEDPYPNEAKENFVDSCATSAKRARPRESDETLRDNCKCIVDALEDRVPYAREGANNDFKDIDRAGRDGRELTGALNDDVEQATASCAE
jgi:hypothetical protein